MTYPRRTALGLITQFRVCGYCVALLAGLAGCAKTVDSQTPPAKGPFAEYDAKVRGLVEQMTLEEKIGQMTQADLAHLGDLTDIKKYFLGSVLSGGDSDPTEGNSLAAWTDTYDRCQEKALETRLAIPILYGVDAVHGHSNVLGAVMFPHNIGLGCTRNPELARISQMNPGRMACDLRLTPETQGDSANSCHADRRTQWVTAKRAICGLVSTAL